MKYLWIIRDAINKNYKDGDDWVYAKGKKKEIELIKDLYEMCSRLEERNFELAEQIKVLDEWEAYEAAEHKLGQVKKKFMSMSEYIDAWTEAQERLKAAEQYLRDVAEKIEKMETASED